jgi:hypothetical protein
MASIKSRIIPSAVTLMALLGVGAGLAAAEATSAAAVTTHKVNLCSQGNYSSYIIFGNGASVGTVRPGECRSMNLPNAQGVEVRGIYNTSSNTFHLADVWAPTNGVDVYTKGTTAAGNHWAEAYYG